MDADPQFDAWLRSWRSPLWFALSLLNIAFGIWVGVGHHWQVLVWYAMGVTVCGLFEALRFKRV